VNALSKNLECWIKRGGKGIQHQLQGRQSPLEARSRRRRVGKNNTGTKIRFWPDAQFFESVGFSVRSSNVLRAKAVLCPGLRVTLKIEGTDEKDEWFYTGGVNEYLREALGEGEWLPPELFVGSIEGEQEAAEWAVAWRIDEGAKVEESYVNLIPTPQGGTHVNGLRVGLTDAIREFCEFHNLLPKVELAPEDVWDDVSYVLSTKMKEAQFAGQTKERLTSRNRRIRFGRREGPVRSVAESASGIRREDCAGRDRACASSSQGIEGRRTQTHRQWTRAARQACRLHIR
jgi:topoisomerase-4 subunit B